MKYKNSTVAINRNNISFGLARHLKNNLSHKKYNINWDPVFKIFSYPGSGNLLNDKSPKYYPFTRVTTLLNKESFCIFTEDAF